MPTRTCAARAERGDLLFGTMDCWLTWNLTGGVDGGLHVTDVTNASRTMLMNLETLHWDPLLLEALRVPASMLPEIRPTIGGGRHRRRRSCPVFPIGAIIGDQQASLFGQTAFDAGEAKCTFGTGSFLLLNTGTRPVRSAHGLITTVAHKIGDEPAVYALEGSVAVGRRAGPVVPGQPRPHPHRSGDRDAGGDRADNGGCYVVPAFSGLFAPYWNPAAQGVLVGLTAVRHQGAHRPGGAGGDGLADPRRDGRDERRRRASPPGRWPSTAG